LIAGKGHEDYQIYGQTRRSFSDRSAALRHLGAAA
jgi:UDP-N-acetylmuramyl tripeptide synthase